MADIRALEASRNSAPAGSKKGALPLVLTSWAQPGQLHRYLFSLLAAPAINPPRRAEPRPRPRPHTISPNQLPDKLAETKRAEREVKDALKAQRDAKKQV
eukprot:CAMPEP_0182910884 /NCGR_PEP_ID=MMETSP0034_2-20130328/36589_1 /TAXON_ID=156128 /ORGANISM="Nephroselmis pyriformis, Strain CCMP717" /LENGTH=99 /DNA_ID=CAMNT_0025047307 /DNA_START=21 /DNA_END=316 /DNA_ORIENTATION=+